MMEELVRKIKYAKQQYYEHANKPGQHINYRKNEKYNNDPEKLWK